MEYIFVLVLGIIYILWLIVSIKDIINTSENFFFTHIWVELKGYSKLCVISHIICLSGYGLFKLIIERI